MSILPTTGFGASMSEVILPSVNSSILSESASQINLTFDTVELRIPRFNMLESVDLGTPVWRENYNMVE